MRAIITIAISLILSLGAIAQVEFYEGSFEEAKALAKKEGKPLFIDFYADWCMPCKQMEKYGFRDPHFAKSINSLYVAIKIDIDQFVGMDLAESYRVNKYPTLIITDFRGKEVRRREGYQSTEDLNRFVEEG